MKLFYTDGQTDSRAFLAAALLRCGISGPDVRRTPNGKPYLADKALRFSLTHTDSFTAVALSPQEVGIDAERKKPRNIRTVLSRLTPAEREEDFLRLWTAKEAYVKYRGGTLAGMLPRLTYARGVLEENGAPVRVGLFHFELCGCVVCVCSEEETKPEPIRL